MPVQHKRKIKMTEYKPHDLMQFFTFGHLPEFLQEISRPFHATASWVDQNLPDNLEKTSALRKLLEAKDSAVRAKIYNMVS